MVAVVGPAQGGQRGPGVSPSGGDREVVYLQMSDGTALEHGEVDAIASHRPDPLLKSTLPVPNHSSLYLASIFLPLLPYLPLIHALSLSKSFYHSQRLTPSCFCYSLSHSLSP